MIGGDKLHLAILDSSQRHVSLIVKTAGNNLRIFEAAIKRMVPLLQDWIFGTTTGRFDLLKASSNFLNTSDDNDHGILLITCIYFIVNECFLVPFNGIEIKNLK